MQLRTITARYGRKRQPAQYESAEAVIEFTLSVDEDGQIGKLDTSYQNMGIALLATAKNLVLTELGVIKAGDNASAFNGASVAALETVVHSETVSNAKPGDAGGTGPASDGKTTETRKRRTKAEIEADKAAEAAKVTNGPQPAADAANGPQPTNAAAAAGNGSAASIPGMEDAPAAVKQPETALGRTLPEAKPETQSAASIPLDPPASNASVATPAQVTAAANDNGEAVTAAGVNKFITTCLVQKKFLPNVVLGKMKQQYNVDRVYDLSQKDLEEFFIWVQGIAQGKAA